MKYINLISVLNVLFKFPMYNSYRVHSVDSCLVMGLNSSGNEINETIFYLCYNCEYNLLNNLRI